MQNYVCAVHFPNDGWTVLEYHSDFNKAQSVTRWWRNTPAAISARTLNTTSVSDDTLNAIERKLNNETYGKQVSYV